MGNGEPVPGGMDLFPGCIALFDGDGRTVTGVVLRGARRMLQPYPDSNDLTEGDKD